MSFTGCVHFVEIHQVIDDMLPFSTYLIYFNTKVYKSRGGWGCSSVVECLPSMLEALGSIASTEKSNK
jgi:hypothetical protein